MTLIEKIKKVEDEALAIKNEALKKAKEAIEKANLENKHEVDKMYSLMHQEIQNKANETKEKMKELESMNEQKIKDAMLEDEKNAKLHETSAIDFILRKVIEE